MWIELTQSARLGGILRAPQWREDVARRKARRLVDNDQARQVDGPYPSRDAEGFPRDGWDVTEVDGIGQQTARDIYQFFDGYNVLRIDRALEHDFAKIPELDDGLIDDLREHLEQRT